MRKEKKENTFLFKKTKKKGKHIALIYETKPEQLSIAAQYIKQGIKSGEKCIYSCCENKVERISEEIEETGLDTADLIKSGQLSLYTEKETYLEKGFLNINSIKKRIQNLIDSINVRKFSGLRMAGEMSWAHRKNSYMSKLIDYEKISNCLLLENTIRVSAMCQYDYKIFSQDFLKDIIFIHPATIYKNLDKIL